MNSHSYDGFISYRHNDRQRIIARSLQRMLHGFAKPWYRLRAVRLYRDETNLSARPDLWGAIEKALDQSRSLILIGSPEAAESRWVEKEAAHWLATKGQDSIIVVVTEGTVAWDMERGRFDPVRTTALPPAILEGVRREPLWLDLTWVTDAATDLSIEHPRYRDAVASLAATIRGIDKDAITGEDLRERQRAMRLAYGATGTIAALFVIALVAAIGFFLQRGEAERQRDVALARLLASEGFRRNSADPRTSIPYFLTSLGVAETPNAVSGLFQAVQRDPHLTMRLRPLSSRHSAVAFAPNGATAGIGSENGEVTLWRVDRGVPVATAAAKSIALRSDIVLPGLGRPIAALRVMDPPEETVLAIDSDGRILEWSSRAVAAAAAPDVLARLPHEIASSVDVVSRPYASLSAEADVAAASTYEGTFIWTRAGGVKEIGKAIGAAAGPVAVSRNGRKVALTLAGHAGASTPAVIVAPDHPSEIRKLRQLPDGFGITDGLAFDSTGDYLALGSTQAYAAVFRAEQGTLLRITDHATNGRLNAGSSVATLALSTGAKYLASIHQRHWHLWDVTSGTQLGLRVPVTGATLAFRPREQMLLVGRDDRIVHLVDFTLTHLSHLACLQSREGIPPSQWRELAGDVPYVRVCRG
jgi:hypothetical protein